jgi:alkanesulfonate monooxygenase SsuD/methylene tetrahydromethanopterin reductase-like flavin-dependent oxidoreductase (luciferase family)
MDRVHSRSPRIGLILPYTDMYLAGGTPHWSDLMAQARLAEDVGFDSVWVPDHLLFRFPGTNTGGAWDCWSLLAALAAVTSRVALGPIVTCTGFRNPALLAKIADTVDEISGGRLILGLGAGWNEAEFHAFGYPFDHLASRFEEALTIITGLLRHGQVDFAGTYYQARECELRPRGPRPNGLPIMIGTTGARMLGLTAQHADAWNAWFDDTANRPEGIAPLRAKVNAACAAVGRDPATLARTAAVLVKLPGGPDRLTGIPFESDTVPLVGSPDELAEELRAFGHAGITHLQVMLLPSTPAGIGAFAPVLEILDRA